jgi:hypothetical protein
MFKVVPYAPDIVQWSGCSGGKVVVSNVPPPIPLPDSPGIREKKYTLNDQKLDFGHLFHV